MTEQKFHAEERIDINNVSKESKIKTVLYNAVSLLIDETWDQYDGDSKQEWFDMLFNNLGVSGSELEAMGIKVTVDGGLKVVDNVLVQEPVVENSLMSFIEEEVPFRMRECVGAEITDDECTSLVAALKENTDVLFDYDAVDNFLTEKLDEMRGVDSQKVRAIKGEIHNLRKELNGAAFYVYDEDTVMAIEKRLCELTLRLEACEQGKSFLPEVFKVDAATVERVVRAAVEDIHGTGVANGSGYYEVNGFETDEGRVSLMIDVSVLEDESGYQTYYVLGFAEGGDDIVSGWVGTERLDMDALCKAVCEISNTDFSEDVETFFKNKQSINKKLDDAAQRSQPTVAKSNTEIEFGKE